MARDWNIRTKLVHEGTRRSQYGEMAEAIFLTQGFAYPDAETAAARFANPDPEDFVYARYGNPTVRMFEDRMAALEGTEDAFATASGMAAVSAALVAMLKAGDHVVAARALFGSSLYLLNDLLPRFGVETTLVDGGDLAQWQAAIRPGTRAVLFESMANPTLDIVDIAAVARIAHAAGALVLVDNVFATPVFSDAVAQGADVVIYSTTKHVDGQGRALGGVICGTRDYIRTVIEPYIKHTGAAMSPFTAWIMLNGLTTLDLRARAMADSALAVATALEGHPKLAQLIYPGLASHPQHDLAMQQFGSGGTMIALDVAGGATAAFRVMNAFGIVRISNNLGDARSIATHPATTTHQRLGEAARADLGITPGMIRLSVGLEDPADLIADLRQALDQA